MKDDPKVLSLSKQKYGVGLKGDEKDYRTITLEERSAIWFLI